ncbi:MAG TPA: hypothetical protein VGF99_09795, partial [Myxococcota bacterium]
MPDGEAVTALVEQHGAHVQATAALTPGMRVFVVDGVDACIAWTRGLGCSIVLGDPIGAADAVDLVVAAFVAAHPRAVFFQTSTSFM